MSLTPGAREIVDPQVQAIFDAIEAYMATHSLPSCSCSASQSGAGITESLSATEMDGDTYTLQFFTKGTQVLVTPASVSLGPAGTQQFTAAATNPDGTPVASAAFTWALTAGPGTLDASGLYTAPATIAQAVNATIKATLVDGQAWNQVILTVHP